MNAADAKAIIDAVTDWANNREDIRALALVGSWARGNPHPASDLDILLLSDSAADYRHGAWLTEVAFESAGFHLQSHQAVTYGAVWSEHLQLEPDAEVELTFARCSWANVDPIDNGTRQVVNDGLHIIFDRDRVLTKLIDAAMSG
jgi:hypothetical protein